MSVIHRMATNIEKWTYELTSAETAPTRPHAILLVHEIRIGMYCARRKETTETPYTIFSELQSNPTMADVPRR